MPDGDTDLRTMRKINQDWITYGSVITRGAERKLFGLETSD